MTQAELILFVKNILPDVNSGVPPAEAITKAAACRDMSPAQVERAGHVFNTLIVLDHQRKHASDRGAVVPLLDVPLMKQQYEEQWKKKKSEKSADIFDLIDDRVPWRVYEDSAEKAAGSRVSVIAEIAKPGQLKAAAEMAADIADEAYEAAALAGAKFAKEAIRKEIKLNEIREDAWRLYGDGGLDIVDRYISRHFKEAVDDSFKSSDELAADRHNVAEIVEFLAEKTAEYHAALAEKELFEKRAAGASAPQQKTKNKGSGKGSGGKGGSGGGRSGGGGGTPAPPIGKFTGTPQRPIIVPQMPDSVHPVIRVPYGYLTSAIYDSPAVAINLPLRVAEMPQMFTKEMDTAADTAKDVYTHIVNVKAEPVKKLDEKANDEIEKDAFKMRVQFLQLTDPVINKHPVEIVNEIADSIWRASRPVANSLSALRFALREGVQYASVPTSTIKEISDLARNIAQTQDSIEKTKKYKSSDNTQVS